MSRTGSDIKVFDRGPLRIMRVGRTDQSSMYLDNPFETDFDYPGYLHLAVAVVPDARRTLMIGLGGGTVAKRLWRDHPDMHIDAVELDARIAEYARTHFRLPCDERICVHVEDGRTFLESSKETYDIVMVDAFTDDLVPSPLLTEEFHRTVLAHLSPQGAVAYNFHGSVCGDRSKPFRRLYRTLRVSFRAVWAFPVGLSAGGAPGDHREIIVVATNAPLSTEALLEAIENRAGGRVTVPAFHLMGADLYRGGIRTGDVATYRDDV